MCIAAFAVSCSSNTDDIFPENNPPEQRPDTIVVKNPKPKAMWVGMYDVNFINLKNNNAVKTYLLKCKSTGFNMIYMDSGVATGYTLTTAPSMKRTDEVDWDLFASVIENCDSLDIDVVISISPLCVGNPKTRKGVAYDSNTWDGKTQCKKVMLEGANYKIVDSKDDPSADAVMLDPSVPEARAYAAQICKELALEYKDHKCFKGIALDYVRYSNADEDGNWYGYGPVEKNFQNEMGLPIDDANDFINATGGFGKYFTEWVYYRTNSVTKTIRQIKEAVKAAVPECELHLWASAQWSTRYSVGQNWASKNYTPAPSKAYIDNDYYKYKDTGFAEDLDVFILGSYAADIYIKDNPGSDWTVENFVKTYDKYIPKSHKCKVYGSLGLYAYNDPSTKQKKTADATYLCLINTDGYMAFELGHVTNLSLWDGLKKGFEMSGY